MCFCKLYLKSMKVFILNDLFQSISCFGTILYITVKISQFKLVLICAKIRRFNHFHFESDIMNV